MHVRGAGYSTPLKYTPEDETWLNRKRENEERQNKSMNQPNLWQGVGFPSTKIMACKQQARTYPVGHHKLSQSS